jgi:hypothetical protein
MESHYDTTFMRERRLVNAVVRRDSYAIIISPTRSLGVKAQEGIDPIKPGTVLHVTEDEFEALRYHRVTIGGILEAHYQEDLRRARHEQMKEIIEARAGMEQPKPVPVKMIIDKNKTTFVYSASNLPMLPGTYKIEVKEVVIV